MTWLTVLPEEIEMIMSRLMEVVAGAYPVASPVSIRMSGLA
jgi:hypothetical protein